MCIATRIAIEETMELRKFGHTQRDVPVIGQGTWQIGGSEWKNAVAALRRGLDLGMTHIDTAEMYGEAENIVGEAIEGRREEVFLVSKVLPENASLRGTVAACERSLARLKTDYLDCYLLHWRGSHPLQETFEAFEVLRAQEKIRAWGVSNFDADDLEDAAAIIDTRRMACNQVLYHLRKRAIEHQVLPWCEARGVSVVAYSPFGHGNFPGTNTREGRVLAEIGRAHGATPRQVALRFLVRRPSVFAIPKASTVEHVEKNAGAGDLRLTSSEIELIDAAFPLGPAPRELPML
jgi:diketogulonate reductase-like aldo/keto reductase